MYLEHLSMVISDLILVQPSLQVTQIVTSKHIF